MKEDTISITRKVFLLSFTELSYSQNGHVGIEGEPLEYFDENQNRFAYTEEGEKTSWWLRSADSTYDSAVYAVGPEGEEVLMHFLRMGFVLLSVWKMTAGCR